MGGDINEVYIPSTCDNKQSLTLVADTTVTGGYFRVGYDGVHVCVPYHSTISEVAALLDSGLSLTNNVDTFVTRDGSGDVNSNYGYTYHINFMGPPYPGKAVTVDVAGNCLSDPVCTGSCNAVATQANTGACNELTGSGADLATSTTSVQPGSM